MKKVIIILSLICAAAIIFGVIMTLVLSREERPGEDTSAKDSTEIPLVTVELPNTEKPDAASTESGETASADKETAPSPSDAANYLTGPGKENMPKFDKGCMTKEFLSYVSDVYGCETVTSVSESVKSGQYTTELWFRLTQNSLYVLWGNYSGSHGENCRVISGGEIDRITLAFGGDISLADNWTVMSCYGRRGKTLSAILDPELTKVMQGVDIMALNNEFTVSERGTPINKTYTFKAKPQNLSLYNAMGVDFVSLANNHIYDYGPQAFTDTLTHLKGYGIDFAGAGESIKDASQPFYYIINGRKIAILCGSRAEKNRVTPVAGSNTSGVFGIYESRDMVNAVRAADESSDIVIVFAHWGKEDSPIIEDAIRSDAAEYVKAGADIIIGAHAHQLQGMEYIDGTPVFYNLGNFLFEEGRTKTGLAKIEIDPMLNISLSFVPCIQDDCYTYLCKGDEAREVWDYLLSLSPGIRISEDGYITEK